MQIGQAALLRAADLRGATRGAALVALFAGALAAVVDALRAGALVATGALRAAVFVARGLRGAVVALPPFQVRRAFLASCTTRAMSSSL